jgi:iron(II)-dependent oxidoreductase
MAMGWFSRKTAEKEQAFEPAARVQVSADPLEAAWQQRRYGLFARRSSPWTEQPSWQKMHAAALAKLDEDFVLLPEGGTSLALHINAEPGTPETDVQTQPFLLARCAVTNADYQLFVDARAYEDCTLWPEEVWPHLIKFRDQSGAFGPRYWQNGCHDTHLARHPVVGVCWYEAVVYAAWAGLRLPTEAEWQVTACWQLGAGAAPPRRFPWGEALDLECCNIWGSGHSRTLPVDGCPAGATPNGVLQLIGNVWEWVDGDFECTDDEGRMVVGEAALKSIRGGAFDTYFPWQATSVFRSGLPPLARMHNVGFRCALDLIGEDTAPQ